MKTKAIVYEARPNEWLVIINPDTDGEKTVATLISKAFAVTLCEAMGYQFTISESKIQ